MKNILMLGIDGGGTKTRYMLGDASGHVLADITALGLDYQSLGYDGVESRISETVNKMLEPLGRGFTDIASVCAGMPRIGEFAEWDVKCGELLKKLFPEAKVHCVNDVQIGLYGSLCLGRGIHLVSGTGSIAIGMGLGDTAYRCGGWHEDFSDEGSGYRIGLKAWELFSKQFDGRLPKTCLYDLVLGKTGLTDPTRFVEYFEMHLANRRDAVASYQPLLEKSALSGDRMAVEVYRQAAEELAQMALAVYRALEWKTPVELSYSGGVFRCGGLILDPLKEALKSYPIVVLSPRMQPAQGALLYAVCSENTDPAFRESAARNIQSAAEYEDV